MTVRYVTLDETLKLLRKELKREWPATRFSVTRGRGTGYSFVDVRWTDGPTVAAVNRITSGYEGEGFDGMTDSSYNIKHTEADASGNPVTIQYGTRGILTHRDISPAFARRLLAQVVAYWKPDTAPYIVAYAGYDGNPCWKLSDDNARIEGEYVTTWMHRASSDATRYALTAQEEAA